MSVIREFLISVGFAADERSANAAESRIKRVEATARKSDEARTKLTAEQSMERARRMLKAAGIENASLAQIMAKRKELDEAEAGFAKRFEEHDRRQTHARVQAAAGLRTISNVAIGAAVAVQAATLAFAGFATQVAGKLEAMAYASERTGSSVKDLKVFSQAVSQLGGTAGGALNDLESFAGRLRSNPQGYTAFLKSVGVEARDAKGNIKGAAQLYKEFRAEVGKRKPYEEQLLYGQEIGVSEETWRASDPAKLAAEETALRAKHARMGFDPDAAKEDAKGLQHAFRDMWDSISIVGEKAASKIFADVGGNLKSFTTFVEQHGDQIAEILSKVAQIVLAVSRAFLELATSDRVKSFLDGVLNTFGKVDDATGKWTANTEGIKDALEALAIFVATVFVAKITGAFADVLKQAKPLLALLAPLLKLLGIGGSLGVGVAIGSAVGADAAVPNAQKPGVTNHWDDEASGAAGGAGIGGALKRAWQWGKNAVGMGGGGQSGAKPVGSWWTPERQQQALKKLQAGGVTELGAKALVARWAAVEAPGGPASVNPTSGAFGIGQWLGSRKRPVAGNTDFDTQLDHAVNELNTTEKAARDRLNSAKTDQEAATGASMFERAEGYDARSGRDNFTDATAAAMKRLGETGRQSITGSKEVAGGAHPLDGQGRLTSDISAARVNPVTGQTRPHKGIDLAAPAGTNVKAMTDGIVSLGSHGDITVKQASGASTTYRHVAPSVEDGARVAAGSIIAQLKANDPRSTGPHLHLEARDKDGTLMDPKGLLAPKPEAPAAAKPEGTVADQAKGVVNRFNDAIGRLDTTKLRAFGEATQGFDPGKFFTVPPAGTEGATNNSSVKHQTFNGGTTHITQNVQGGADEGAAVFRRHKERQNADDVRYASSVFA